MKNNRKNCSWSQYNKSLINRGSITFWMSKDSIKKWKDKKDKKHMTISSRNSIFKMEETPRISSQKHKKDNQIIESKIKCQIPNKKRLAGMKLTGQRKKIYSKRASYQIRTYATQPKINISSSNIAVSQIILI